VALSGLQRDGLAEYITIGVGRAAAQLSAMTGRPVALSVPRIWLVGDLAEVAGDGGPVSFVEQGFTGPLAGSVALVFPVPDGHRLVCLMLGEEVGALPDAERAAALTEVGNVVVNAVMGSFANLTRLELAFALPEYREGPVADLAVAGGGALLAAEVGFALDGQAVHGRLLLFFAVATIDRLAALLDEAAG
jgi:chemotaxis protein CheC